MKLITLAASAALAALAISLPSSPTRAADGETPAQTDLVKLEDFFRGTVVKWTAEGDVEIAYDFEDPVQMKDFTVSCPFRAINSVKFELERGMVRFKGTGSLRHRAVFKETVGATVDFRPARNRDFGLAVSEENESEIFTLYCLYDRYFGLGDGVHTPQNMIIKFIARDPKVNKDGIQDWRYCGSRGAKPVIERGKTYNVKIERGDNRSLLSIDDDWEAKGKEAGRDLVTQMVAIYGYECDVRFDNLTVRGRLDPAFVAKHRLDLTEPAAPPPGATDEPAEPEIPLDEAERIRAQIASYPGRTKPTKLARMLRDPEIPASLRKEAVARALEVKSKKIVPYLVDGLYAAEEASRRLSFDVVKGLLNKTFGYRADAPLEARARAIKALNKYIKQRRTDFL